MLLAGMPSCRTCTDESLAAINVIVVDEATGERICDAEVTVTDGSFSETLYYSGCGHHGGAWERPGTYRVTVSHSDYFPKTIENVRVTKDECDVNPQNLTVALSPGKPECQPGSMFECTCPSGASGTKTCGPDGKLTSCQGC
jgi:hypothetical protein